MTGTYDQVIAYSHEVAEREKTNLLKSAAVDIGLLAIRLRAARCIARLSGDKVGYAVYDEQVKELDVIIEQANMDFSAIKGEAK